MNKCFDIFIYYEKIIIIIIIIIIIFWSKYLSTNSGFLQNTKNNLYEYIYICIIYYVE